MKHEKKVGARVMWADRLDGPTVGLCSKQHVVHPHRVVVIPADPASVAQMREQAHTAVFKEFTSRKGPPGLKDYSDAVLRSLSLVPPQGKPSRKGKKGEKRNHAADDRGWRP